MSRSLKLFFRVSFLLLFITVSIWVIDLEDMRAAVIPSFHWMTVIMITVVYCLAFVLRAIAWRLSLMDTISLKWGMIGIFYSFVMNHILPIKAGDLIRAGVVTTHHDITYRQSLFSVVALRSLDLIILGSIALFGAFYFGYHISSLIFFLIVACLGIGMWFAWIYRSRFIWIRKGIDHLIQLGWRRSLLIISISGMSWILEGIVLYEVSNLFSEGLSFFKSVWANSVTIAGQVFHFTPGGLGTYESVMTGVLLFLGISLKTGYTLALLTHLYKFILSFIIGIILVIWTPIPWASLKGWIRKKGEHS
ncbi:lysylphosphatidylglycerol synthase transmembrane domain-containing protein [Pseudalkalibacillus sp. SCS-8]|uniref:lysylphosphatidylglycerol synthase transmembrane domain-containing protein n=1 Tax=Pseudalkalibacillus nanhaiensis TaxID=3115291 RepID=UPI0032DB0E16